VKTARQQKRTVSKKMQHANDFPYLPPTDMARKLKRNVKNSKKSSAPHGVDSLMFMLPSFNRSFSCRGRRQRLLLSGPGIRHWQYTLDPPS